MLLQCIDLVTTVILKRFQAICVQQWFKFLINTYYLQDSFRPLFVHYSESVRLRPVSAESARQRGTSLGVSQPCQQGASLGIRTQVDVQGHSLLSANTTGMLKNIVYMHTYTRSRTITSINKRAQRALERSPESEDF